MKIGVIGAGRIGGHRTNQEAVTAALDEYIRRRRQREVLKLFGTIDYAKDYDYKKNRRHHQGKKSADEKQSAPAEAGQQQAADEAGQ